MARYLIDIDSPDQEALDEIQERYEEAHSDELVKLYNFFSGKYDSSADPANRFGLFLRRAWIPLFAKKVYHGKIIPFSGPIITSQNSVNIELKISDEQTLKGNLELLDKSFLKKDCKLELWARDYDEIIKR